jgi:uncharacterized DUF497 family protein
MDFDWSEDKRRRNVAKHGLDFADVAALEWETATILEDQRTDYGEPRYWAFAMWKGRLHLVAFTLRGTARNRKVRIISFRRASRKEVVRHGKT